MARAKKTVRKKRATKKRRSKKVPSKVPSKDSSETPTEGSDAVKRLTENEALRFGKLDAEIRNHMQGIQLATFQTESVTTDYNNKIKQLKERKVHLHNEAARAKVEYDSLLNQLAEDYGIPDPSRIIIDPDAGTIRDSKVDL